MSGLKQKDWAIAMANGREFGDARGWIYKFSEEAVFRNSPFIVLRHGTWEPIDSRWCHFDEVEEIFGNMPNLAVNTNVMVKDEPLAEHEWIPAHFKKWNKGKIICFAERATSFSVYDNREYSWDCWKVDDGAHKGKSNVKQDISTKQEIKNE